MNSLPVAFEQLSRNPAPLLAVAVVVVAFTLLVRFLGSRPREWRFSHLTLMQLCGMTALLALISGMGWVLSYDSAVIAGTVPSYLAGLTSSGFRLSLAGCAFLGLAMVARFLMRYRLGFIAFVLLLLSLASLAFYPNPLQGLVTQLR